MKNKLSIYLLGLLFSSITSALEIKGEWIQGGMLVGTVSPEATVEFMGKTPRISEKGQFVIGLGRDAAKNVKLNVLEGGEKKTYQFEVKQRQYREQRIEGVPQETVTPPAEVSARIKEEAELVWVARSNNAPQLDFLQGFSSPLEGPITGVYGSRRVYNGVPKRPHYGVDIAAPTGTIVVAPAPGTVRLSHKDMYFSGGTLILDHGHGVFSTFIHLSEVIVKPNQRVAAGEPIARVGASGRATGPHLDWRINWFDVRVDPAIVLENFPAASQ